jgi:solute carrier family 8 (sodium/calcium exchanger)
VANLTLMALGSSAPEILLSIIETVGNLGKCPGELGASTIVGSAAFNLLIISALSILAVNEKNDNNPERDPSVPKGVKKIKDMGVFSITTISSLFAYIWIYLVLRDQMVEVWEAILTFVFFFILIITSYSADKYNQFKEEKEKKKQGVTEEAKPTTEYSPIEIYRELIAEKKGIPAKNEDEVQKRKKMKEFLK